MEIDLLSSRAGVNEAKLVSLCIFLNTVYTYIYVYKVSLETTDVYMDVCVGIGDFILTLRQVFVTLREASHSISVCILTLNCEARFACYTIYCYLLYYTSKRKHVLSVKAYVI